MKNVFLLIVVFLTFSSCRKDNNPDDLVNTNSSCANLCTGDTTILVVQEDSIVYKFDLSGHLVYHGRFLDGSVPNTDNYTYSNDTLKKIYSVGLDVYSDNYAHTSDQAIMAHSWSGPFDWGMDSIVLLTSDKILKYYGTTGDSATFFYNSGRLDSMRNEVNTLNPYSKRFQYTGNLLTTVYHDEGSGDVVHYTFEYGTQNELVKINVYNVGNLHYSISYNYDTNGDLYSSLLESSNGYTYTYHYCQCGPGNIKQLDPAYLFSSPALYRQGMWIDLIWIGGY